MGDYSYDRTAALGEVITDKISVRLKILRAVSLHRMDEFDPYRTYEVSGSLEFADPTLRVVIWDAKVVLDLRDQEFSLDEIKITSPRQKVGPFGEYVEELLRDNFFDWATELPAP